MNICFVTEHFPPHIGGVEKVFEEYAYHLVSLGHSVRVVTSNSGGVSGKKELTQNLVVFFIPGHEIFGHPILPLKTVLQHVQWADIVHTTTYTAALPALTASKKLHKPCILMVHEVLNKEWFLVEKNFLKAMLFFLFEKFIIKRKYTRWHAISFATKKSLTQQNIPLRKISLIHHGIDQSLWNTSVRPEELWRLFQFKKTDKIFLYNGRPGKTKGIFTLIEAIKEIKDVLPSEFKFGFILPKNPENERRLFEKKIQQYGLGNLVRFVDPLPYKNLPGYRKNAYAFIVPSLTEGFGFSAAETAALDIPLIVSDAGSLPEVVSGKVLFFERGNSSDLGKKIIMATQGNFQELPARDFDWKKATVKLQALYQELL